MLDNGKVNNVVRISTSINTSFFRIWVEFLTPLHKLTKKEKDIMACFLEHRFRLSRSITDEELLDDILMGRETKAKIREECGISTAFFQGILAKFKDNGVLVNGRINPKFIPKNLDNESKSFKLLLYFDLK